MTFHKILEVGIVKQIFLFIKKNHKCDYDICLRTNNISEVGTTHLEELNEALKTAIMKGDEREHMASVS